MGFITRFLIRPSKSPLRELPSGSFTIAGDGTIMASTLPRTFPIALVRDMGERVVQAFGAAQAAELRLSELVIHFASLKIVARQAKSSIIVFVAPKSSRPGG